MKKLGFDLILLGDPTAGKDTQARILMSLYNLKPVESGKYWRAMAKRNTAEGRLLRKTINLGRPTPVPLMKEFLINNLKKRNKNQDLIFIGNPRLKPEAQLLVKLLKQENRDFFVLYLKISQQEIFRRARLRAESQNRLDDSQIKYIKTRISWQDHNKSKAVKYFQSLKKLKFVNAVSSIPNVSKQINKILNDYSRSKRN